MKLSTMLLTVAALAFGAIACATAPHRANTATTAADADATGVVSSVIDAPGALVAGGYDTDDEPARYYGHEAGGANAKAIAAVVKDYYMDGARGDGAAACALTVPAFAATVPYDYGQELGAAIPPGAESYLRGAKTCAAVLSFLFEHTHNELAAPIEVTGVRLKGDYGYALVGSTTLPASRIEVGREGGVWRVDGLLGRPIP